jgi:hypothetical protein
MGKENLYLIGNAIFFIALIFNVLETWYFGWNIKASCPAEMICDYISKFGVFAGASIMVYAAFIKFWEV